MLKYKTKLFWIKFGLVSAFAAAFVFLVGTTVAMLLYPNYSFFYQFISELGVRQDVWISFENGGEWLYKALHPEALNVTLIITGVLFYPFFPAVYFILTPKELWRKVLIILMTIGGCASGTFLSLVGVFDVGMFLEPHVVVALGCYFSVTVVYLLWGIIVITLEKESLYKKSKLWIIDPMICLLGIFIGVVNTGLFNIIDYVGGIDFLAFYQKSLAYVFVILFCFVGIRMAFILKNNREVFAE